MWTEHRHHQHLPAPNRRLGYLESHAQYAFAHLQRLGPLALEFVWPTRCAGCERLGALLCDECSDALPRIDQASACPRCGAPAGRLVCTECTPAYEKTAFSFTHACCALEFSELTRRVILAYKDGGERRLAPLLARLIAEAVPLEWRRWADALTWIPADPQALRRRGFDHMELIAQALAARLGLHAQPTLIKRARADQRRLGRAQRGNNARALFQVRQQQAPQEDLPPHHSPHRLPSRLLLIDDVFTTGATLESATRTLLSSGAREVRVAAIARVW
ncbi:MAG: ComF family protein [Coriobacteriales bacterium]|jgi:ComF family protein|nr:ComF family protein [Coriobacteriales bacterium]